MTNPCQGHAAESARAEKPEALRLADALNNPRPMFGPDLDDAAAAELRRLHALCDELGEALERIASLDYANAAINCCALTAVEISQAALTKWKESK